MKISNEPMTRCATARARGLSGQYASMFALALSLAACGPAQQPPPKQAKVVHRDWVVEIRQQASRLESAVEVAPLPDTAIADLSSSAHRYEEAKDFDAAERALKQAIAIRAERPDLWQWWAEIALERGAWAEAEQRATHAFDHGPKIGSLCARSWLTIAAARTERNDAAGAASAQAEVAKCQVSAPVRM